MAKLNGVKTVDMVNGEITKVVYDGAEYAKVDGKAEVGDIVINNRIHRDLTKGGYYSVIRVYDTETIRVTDDVSDGHDIRKSLICGPFRKISAQSKPTLEQRVETLESDVAALKGEEQSSNTFNVGDTIKVVRNTASWGKKEKAGYHVGGQGVVKVGAIGEVTSVSGDFVTAKFAYGDVNGGGQRKRELRFDEIELAEETIELEGVAYRKVDREAREGDVVIFRKNTSNCASNNKPYMVAEVFEGSPKFYEEGSRFNVYFGGYNRTRETVDVYEPIEQAKYVPQEGDIVVITGNTNHSNNKVGDIGKVTEIKQGRRTFRVQTPNGPDFSNWTEPTDVRKATPAEVEKYEQAVKDANMPKLKAGDFVKFNDKQMGITAEKLYEVYEKDGVLSIKDDDGDWRYGGVFSDEHEILSAEEAKWAKIGRKPNEFKKGDVVRFTSKYNPAITGINTVTRVEENRVFYDSTRHGNAEEYSFISEGVLSLVAPVESLFNA